MAAMRPACVDSSGDSPPSLDQCRRNIAGTSTLSNHAFGLALDINAVENQRGTAGLIDRSVVRIFQSWGFTWGGDWHYTDPMHFEMNTLVTPTLESARKK